VFEIGDNVVYPHHGAGVVQKKETKKLLGEERDYLTIKITNTTKPNKEEEKQAAGKGTPKKEKDEDIDPTQATQATESATQEEPAKGKSKGKDSKTKSDAEVAEEMSKVQQTIDEAGLGDFKAKKAYVYTGKEGKKGETKKVSLGGHPPPSSSSSC